MAVTGGRDNRGSMDSEKLGLRASKQWQSTGGWDPGTSMVVRYGKSSKNMWMAERAQQSLGTAAGASYFAKQEQKRKNKIRNVKSTLDMGSARRKKKAAPRLKHPDLSNESPLKLPSIDPHGPMAPPRQQRSPARADRSHVREKVKSMAPPLQQRSPARGDSDRQLVQSTRNSYEVDFHFSTKAHKVAARREGGITYEDAPLGRGRDHGLAVGAGGGVRGGGGGASSQMPGQNSRSEEEAFNEAILQMRAGAFSMAPSNAFDDDDEEEEELDGSDLFGESLHAHEEMDYVPKYGMNKMDHGRVPTQEQLSGAGSGPPRSVAHSNDTRSPLLSSQLDAIRRDFGELRAREKEHFKNSKAKDRRPTQAEEDYLWEPSLNAREHASNAKNGRKSKIPRPKMRYTYEGQFEKTPGYEASSIGAAHSSPGASQLRDESTDAGPRPSGENLVGKGKGKGKGKSNLHDKRKAARRERERAKVRQEVRDAVRMSGWDLIHAPDELRADREIVLLAVRNVGQALHCASPALQDDREVVLTALTNDATALQYASKYKQNDREVVTFAVSRNGAALQWASEELRSDRQVVLAAVLNDLGCIRFADPGLQNDRQVRDAMQGLYHFHAEVETPPRATAETNAEKNGDAPPARIGSIMGSSSMGPLPRAAESDSDPWLSLRAARLRVKLKEAVSDIDVDPRTDDDNALSQSNGSPAKIIADSYRSEWETGSTTRTMSFGQQAASQHVLSGSPARHDPSFRFDSDFNNEQEQEEEDDDDDDQEGIDWTQNQL